MVLKWSLSFRFSLESIFIDLQMTDNTLNFEEINTFDLYESAGLYQQCLVNDYVTEWIAALKLPPPPPPHSYNGPSSPSAHRRDYYEAEYYHQAGGYGSPHAYGPHYDHSNMATPAYDVHRY